MSDPNDPSGSGTRSAGPPPASQRADPLGSWITAGIIGVVFLLFFFEARELPSDIQRWPYWLLGAGAVLLAIYAFQQAALKREWAIVEKADELTTITDEGDASSRTSGTEIDEEDEAGGQLHEPAGTHDDGSLSSDEVDDARDTSQYGNPDDYTRYGDRMTAASSALFVLFAVAAYGFGFLPATLVFVPLYMLFNGERHVGKLVGMSLGMSVGIYLLFGSILNTPLTRGEWYRPDWLISWIPF